MNPSEHLDTEWLYAYHPHSDTPRGVGKWLIFFSPQYIDEWWTKIAEATEAGELGPMSKVSTGLYARGNRQVIQVYAVDVERVRERLRELGVTWRIYHKEERRYV